MRAKFKLLTIDFFNQEKLIEHNINLKQICILKALFVMMNNNISKDGSEYRKTIVVDNETYYDFNQWDIIDAIPICEFKTKRQLQRELAPLIQKGFIVKYPIATKFLIKLNLEKLLNIK